MGKKGKKGQAEKPKKLTPKDVGKRLNALAKNLEEELKGADDLFVPLPPTEDCAICLLPLYRVCLERNTGFTESLYKACCGNAICRACHRENEESINKQNEENTGKKIVFACPFCREPEPTSHLEYVHQLQARCLKNDRNAFTVMGDLYRRGDRGLPKDDLKSLDYYIRAVELGSPEACRKIGISYDLGEAVANNRERVALFERAGALRGDIAARNNIGYSEYDDLGNHEIGIRHWKIAAEAGLQESLNSLRKIYNADGKLPGKEFISKEYLESTYRACHDAQMEVKSEERERHRAEEEWYM